jgi:hypothetical protein
VAGTHAFTADAGPLRIDGSGVELREPHDALLERRVGREAPGEVRGLPAALQVVRLLEPQVRVRGLEAGERRRVLIEAAQRIDHRLRVAQHLRGRRVREVLALPRHGEADQLGSERREQDGEEADDHQQRLRATIVRDRPTAPSAVDRRADR